MSTRIQARPRLERSAPPWSAVAASLPEPAELAGRQTGQVVTDHRTSWVRRITTTRGDIFVKTYEYSTWTSRLRDLGRRTAPWGTPRSWREFDALAWLHAHGLPTAAPLAVCTWRRFGFVVRTTLVTAACPGEAASTLLPQLATAERIHVAEAIGRFVHRLHEAGFRDGNLDLRNLIVARRGASVDVAKIDSPRWRLVAAGPPRDALARADWQRLLPQLAAFGLAAAAQSTGSAPV